MAMTPLFEKVEAAKPRYSGLLPKLRTLASINFISLGSVLSTFVSEAETWDFSQSITLQSVSSAFVNEAKY
jgi:hypothetical protein